MLVILPLYFDQAQLGPDNPIAATASNGARNFFMSASFGLVNRTHNRGKLSAGPA
jgi:hypothetical protein